MRSELAAIQMPRIKVASAINVLLSERFTYWPRFVLLCRATVWTNNWRRSISLAVDRSLDLLMSDSNPQLSCPILSHRLYDRIHFTSLRKRDPKGSADDLDFESRDILTENKVNQIFFAWLDEHRKNSKISYHEEGLT